METVMFSVGCLLVSLPTAALCSQLIEESKAIKAMAYLLSLIVGLVMLVTLVNVSPSDTKAGYKQIEGTNVYRKIK
jgi:hypothetical protein